MININSIKCSYLRREAEEFGYAIKLHCPKCMSIPKVKDKEAYSIKTWGEEEFDFLTKKEYSLLVHYHDLTCKGTIGA